MTAFHWKLAQEECGHELHARFLALQLLERLKYGHLYACRLCGQHWFLDDAGSTLFRIPGERREILQEWNENQLSIEPAHLAVLDAIGATAPKYWMGQDRVIAIPCAISLYSGEYLNPAIVWVSKRPPIDLMAKRVRLYRTVRAVEPSRYALPLEVRLATILASEVSMGFSPTRVESTQGVPFVLHWATSLFDQEGIAGNEIHRSKRPFRADEQITVAETDFVHATYFYADWLEGAENLNQAQPENRSPTISRSFWKQIF